MKVVEVVCEVCDKKFEKPLNEYNRSKKVGRGFFCSRSCSGKKFNSHLDRYKGKNNGHLDSFNRRDEYTPFRPLFTRSRNKARNATKPREFSVTLQDLKDQWEKQEGYCEYTDLKLSLPKSSGQHDPVRTASLDRKDSSKGYVKGNIHFVSMMANWAKNEVSDMTMRDFIDAVRDSDPRNNTFSDRKLAEYSDQ